MCKFGTSKLRGFPTLASKGLGESKWWWDVMKVEVWVN